MFPFNYIPETIDPKLRKILIILITIQFISFLAFIILLTYQHINKKKEAKQKEIPSQSLEEKNETSESHKDESKPNKKKRE